MYLIGSRAFTPALKSEETCGSEDPRSAALGDRILFGKWSGTEVKVDGDELLIMKESDIMGVIETKASKKAAA